MKQIIVSGFGGQGVISLGIMLSYAAMKENLNTSFIPSYGPEMRGGTANCSVVISDREVASPVISSPDVLVALNEPSIVKFMPSLAKGGHVYVDDDTAPEKYKSEPAVVSVPLRELAAANPKGQNIAMLGVILAETGLSVQAAEGAVREVFKNKPQFIDSNLSCLHAGIEWAAKR